MKFVFISFISVILTILVSLIVLLKIGNIEFDNIYLSTVVKNITTDLPKDKNYQEETAFTPKSFNHQVLYYVKTISDGKKNFCSGLKHGEEVLTIKHCINNIDNLNDDRVVIDYDVHTEDVVITKDIIVTSNQDKEFSIGTVDMGAVGAIPSPGCADSLCYFFDVKSYKPPGQGNSGSPLFDSDGEYVGALSAALKAEEMYNCDIIYFVNEKVRVLRDSDRYCSFYLRFATSEEFRKKILIEK